MIDPWTSSSVDYDKIINQFGIKKFSDIIDGIEDPLPLMTREVIFGHRSFDKMATIINNHKDFSVVTGMMPSGNMHIGHKMIVDQLKWYLNKRGKLFIPIADIESYGARGINFNQSKTLAINEYLSNYIALGLDLTNKNVYVYLQSQNDTVKDLAFELSKKTNFNELKAIYGFSPSTSISHIYVPLVQAADILLPQTEEYYDQSHVIVPVGLDQDPHIRLTRDLVDRFKSQFKFIPPASTYHRFLTNLTGEGKMSSSEPKTTIYLNDPPNVVEKKVKSAKTGGCRSLEEQKKFGGSPGSCVIYEIITYYLTDDDIDLQKTYENCKNGTLSCGECKAITAEKMKKFFEKLATKKEKSLKIAKTLL